MMVVTGVSRLLKRMNCIGGSIGHHPRHGSLALGHLITEGGDQGPLISCFGQMCHMSTLLPILAGQTQKHEPDPEAEVNRGHVGHEPIHPTMITRNSTAKQWFMLQVWQRSCGNDDCS